MTSLFFTYYLISIVALIVCYIIGDLFFRMLTISVKGVYVQVFAKLLVGICIFILACAVYFTTFKTVFCGLFITLVYFFVTVYKKRDKPLHSSNTSVKTFLVLLQFIGVFTLFYAYRFYSITYGITEIPNVPNSDFTYYARTSYYLVNLGVESSLPQLLYPEHNVVDPYHYFDLWLTGAISFISSSNNLLVLLLVNYTLGASWVWLGFCAIAESLNKIHWGTALIAIFCTFLLPIDSQPAVSIYNLISKTGLLLHVPPTYLTFGLWNMPKVYPVYLFFIAAIISFLEGQKTVGIMALSVLSFVFSTIALPVLVTLTFYVIVDYWINRDKKFFLHCSVYIFLNGLFLFLFYVIAAWGARSMGLDPFDNFGREPLYKVILRPLKIFIDANLQVILLYSPFLLLIVIKLVKKMPIKRVVPFVYKKVMGVSGISLIIILYFVSLLCWCLLYRIGDANQFFTTSAIIALNILCGIFFLKHRGVATTFFLVTLSFILVEEVTYDIFETPMNGESYLAEVRDITKHTGGVGGFIFSKEDYKTRHSGYFVEVLGDYVGLFRPDNYPVSLSVFDIDYPTMVDSIGLAKVIQQSDFYKFTQGQKLENKFVSVEQSQVDFIDHFNIPYLIISGNVKLSSVMENRVKKRIVDSSTGQVFLLLDFK